MSTRSQKEKPQSHGHTSRESVTTLESIRYLVLLDANQASQQLIQQEFFTDKLLSVIVPFYHNWAALRGRRYVIMVRLLLGENITSEEEYPQSLITDFNKRYKAVFSEKERSVVATTLREAFDSLEIGPGAVLQDFVEVMAKAVELSLKDLPNVAPIPLENEERQRELLAERGRRNAQNEEWVAKQREYLKRGRDETHRRAKEHREKIVKLLSDYYKSLPTDQIITFQALADYLNTRGELTFHNTAFTANNVRMYLLQEESTFIRTDAEVHQEKLRNILNMLDMFPFDSKRETDQYIITVRREFEELSDARKHIIRQHENYAFIVKEIHWNAPLPSYGLGAIHDYLLERYDASVDIKTYDDLLIFLLWTSPLNGLASREAVIESIRQEIKTIFSPFFHPFAYLEKHHVERQIYFYHTDELQVSPHQTSEYYTPRSGEKIPKEEIRVLLEDEGLSYEETFERLRQTYPNLDSATALRSYAYNTGIAYQKVENDRQARQQEIADFVDIFSHVAYLRSQVQWREAESDQVIENLSRVLEILDLVKNTGEYQSALSEYQQIQGIDEQIELGQMPEVDATLLTQERLLSSNYLIVSNQGAAFIRNVLKEYGAVLIPLRENGVEVANAIEFGTLFEAIVLHQFSLITERFTRKSEFYQRVANELGVFLWLEASPAVAVILTKEITQYSKASSLTFSYTLVEERLRQMDSTDGINIITAIPTWRGLWSDSIFESKFDSLDTVIRQALDEYEEKHLAAGERLTSSNQINYEIFIVLFYARIRQLSVVESSTLYSSVEDVINELDANRDKVRTKIRNELKIRKKNN